jgi:hypothetical protein
VKGKGRRPEVKEKDIILRSVNRRTGSRRQIDFKKLAVLFILLLIIAIVLVGYKYMAISQPGSGITIVPRDTVLVFASAGEGKLARKTLHSRIGASDREKADMIIGALKRESSLPEKVVLYDFTADGNGTMYLSFSKDLKEPGLTTVQEITIAYGIVNSFLATFSDAKQVQLLVEGEPVYTLNGVVYTYKPIQFNKELLED